MRPYHFILLTGLAVPLLNQPVMGDDTVMKLPPCPDSPNCVSSQAADSQHFIEPFTFSTPPPEALLRLKSALLAEHRVTLTREEGRHLQAEARSLIFRFVDDLDFILFPDEGLVHVRSASRTGHSDFGVNRRRVERIRERFSVR